MDVRLRVWVLTPYCLGVWASSFLIEVNTELQKLVKDFYNCNFDDESIADNQTELSQEEHRFMERMKESWKLKNGHYEIALPFKNWQRSVSNNHVKAEQQAMWLKNPTFHDDYKIFIHDLVV